MKIWIVWVDGEQEYASNKFHEANARYRMLENGLGEERVKMTVEIEA